MDASPSGQQYTLQEITNILDVDVGDQVTFLTDVHAIVEDVFHLKNTISIILKEANQVIRKVVNLSEKIYKVLYKGSICLPPDEVLRRALSLLEMEANQLWSSEQFATWCKTGRKIHDQLKQGLLYTAKKAAPGVARGVTTLMMEAFDGTIAGAVSANMMAAVAPAAGVGLVVAGVVDTAIMKDDIRNLNYKRRTGEITEEEFERAVLNRSGERYGDATGGIGGTIAGAVYGSALGPMGAVGRAIIGGLAGGLTGRASGWLLSNYFTSKKENPSGEA